MVIKRETYAFKQYECILRAERKQTSNTEPPFNQFERTSNVVEVPLDSVFPKQVEDMFHR